MLVLVVSFQAQREERVRTGMFGTFISSRWAMNLKINRNRGWRTPGEITRRKINRTERLHDVINCTGGGKSGFQFVTAMKNTTK